MLDNFNIDDFFPQFFLSRVVLKFDLIKLLVGNVRINHPLISYYQIIRHQLTSTLNCILVIFFYFILLSPLPEKLFSIIINNRL